MPDTARRVDSRTQRGTETRNHDRSHRNHVNRRLYRAKYRFTKRPFDRGPHTLTHGRTKSGWASLERDSVTASRRLGVLSASSRSAHRSTDYTPCLVNRRELHGNTIPRGILKIRQTEDPRFLVAPFIMITESTFCSNNLQYSKIYIPHSKCAKIFAEVPFLSIAQLSIEQQ